MRLIDIEPGIKQLELDIEYLHSLANELRGTEQEVCCAKDISKTRSNIQWLKSFPTIDPESLRPTAHIMCGTVRDTYDNAFCSSCRSCLSGDEYFGDVLAHRYKYCPYCGARYVQ